MNQKVLAGVAFACLIAIFLMVGIPKSDPVPTVETPVVSSPAWYDREVIIDTTELEGASARAWKSYEDRTLVFTLSGGEAVRLVDFDPAHDYCKIKKDTDAGWLNCALVGGTP